MSANDLDKKYSEPALTLIKLCVERGYGFMYGGSEYGLMKMASQLVKSLNGHSIAVSAKEFASVVNQKADEIIICKNIGERKKMFMEKSDAIVALPGGTGTLDELTDVIAHKKLYLFNKPVVLLNTRGFWDGLVMQYHRMFADGFLLKNPDDLFLSDDDPKNILKFIQTTLYTSV